MGKDGKNGEAPQSPVELYRKYRPALLKEVIGQERAVTQLKTWLEHNSIPHVVLFSGPTGCGKTTLARILACKMGCKRKPDLREVNCASEMKGIDSIRDLQDHARSSPWESPCRVWIMDESGVLTLDAQKALLKTFEDFPSKFVYFFLCTTDPDAILPAIRGRCAEVKLELLSEAILISLVRDVAGKEGKPVEEEIAEQIARAAEGSGRKSLVLLQQVIDLPAEQQAEGVTQRSVERQAKELSKALLDKARWPQIAAILKGIEDDPERVRRAVLGYADKVMLGGGKQAGRAWMMIHAFKDSVRYSGAPGLHAMAWAISQYDGGKG